MATLTGSVAVVLAFGVLLSAVCADRDVSYERLKRNTIPECKDKYKAIPHHTICLQKSAGAENSGVSDQDKVLIVDRHNELRAKPNAANMLKLEWDDELARIAQHWADNCETVHDPGARRSIPGTYPVGQNLAWNAKDWNQAIQLWYDEVKDFTYGGANDMHAVGHYTQLVWADTHRVGCGYTDCPDKSFYVCNYGPAGNQGDFTKPYKPGKQCADCTGSCTDNLCYCKDPCLNGGTLSRKDCKCKCKRDFYTGTECSLDCSKVTSDPDYCSGEYGNNKCSIIDQDCPNKCHVCPYAAPSYVEGSSAIVKRADESSGTNVRCDVIFIVAMATVAMLKVA